MGILDSIVEWIATQIMNCWTWSQAPFLERWVVT